MKKVFLVISFFLISSGFGCGRQKSVSPFHFIQSGKTLRHVSRFEAIDDFASGVEKNKRGGEWKVTLPKTGKLILERASKDAINRYGGSLHIRYAIPKGERAAISSSLKFLDMSRAEQLIARVGEKSWSRFEGDLFVALGDSDGNRLEINIRPFVHRAQQAGWRGIWIPMRRFRPLNFNRLVRFELIFSAPKNKAIEGKFDIDEIAFFGPLDLFFESARDNIKGFPDESMHRNPEKLSVTSDNELFLKQIAEDTWRFFDQTVDRESGLILDNIRLGRVKGIGSYTSPTDIAFYWLACIGAMDLGLIDRPDAESRISASFKTLEKLERWKNRYYYNFYNTESLEATRRYVSTVDNGWLAAALVVVRQAFPDELGAVANRFLKELDFSVFLDKTNDQLHIGFDAETGSFQPYHYGLLVSEARIASYVAIGKGDVPQKHWADIRRTLLAEWEWQQQIPNGIERELFGVPVFEGYYQYRGEKIVPSWGGSLFEFLSPSLLLKEQTLGRKALGENNKRVVKAHIDYALREKKYPIWGIAPAAIENGKHWKYRELGVKAIAAKGYPDEGIIAPYASILAIEVAPEEVIANLRTMLRSFPGVYGPYGFFDSIGLVRKRIDHQYLALDEGMIFVALANYLTGGAIRNRFHRDPIGKNGEVLLAKEQFYD